MAPTGPPSATAYIIDYSGYEPAVILNESITKTHFVGFAIQLLSTFAFMKMSQSSHGTKIFHYITAACSLLASFAYLMMGLQQGAQIAANGHVILWIRSLDYLLATPLLLLDLGLLAGAGSDELMLMVVSDMLMIATGYWASVATNLAAKWVIFIFSMMCFVPVLYTLVIGLTSHTEIAENPNVKALYSFLVGWTFITWNCFWVIWLLYDGFYVMDMETEVIVHCILDVLAKCIFGFILLIAHSELERMGPGAHASEATITDSAATTSTGASASNPTKPTAATPAQGRRFSIIDTLARRTSVAQSIQMLGDNLFNPHAADAYQYPAQPRLPRVPAMPMPSMQHYSSQNQYRGGNNNYGMPEDEEDSYNPNAYQGRGNNNNNSSFANQSSPGAAGGRASANSDQSSSVAAFLSAVSAGDVERVKSSLRSKPSLIDASEDKTGITALMKAITRNQDAMAKFLVASGANINATDAGGRTAIIYASRNSAEGTVKWLVDLGANVNACDKDSLSPLHHAVVGKNLEAISVLTHFGANERVKDVHGKSPLDVARSMNSRGGKFACANVITYLSMSPEDRSDDHIFPYPAWPTDGGDNQRN